MKEKAAHAKHYTAEVPASDEIYMHVAALS